MDEIREAHTNKLLCKLDIGRALIEIQRRGEKTVIDLRERVRRHIEQFHVCPFCDHRA